MSPYPPDPPPLPGKAVYRHPSQRQYRHTCGVVSTLVFGEQPGARVWCQGCGRDVPADECTRLDGRPLKEL